MNSPNSKTHLIVTGPCGFIGTHFVKSICLREEVAQHFEFHLVDALTYAGRYENIEHEIAHHPHLHFQKLDLSRPHEVQSFFSALQQKEVNLGGVIHFAAETHVDRSIASPLPFYETNVMGTFHLIEASRQWHMGAYKKQNLKVLTRDFCFLHISTDEVYGHLGLKDPAFTEDTPLTPNSPYSASKAASDLLVRSYVKTYKFPAIISRCSNNYGPYQHHEKLIPHMISRFFQGETLPIYGRGENVRDWIHAEDHVNMLWTLFQEGELGEVYNVGGLCEKSNLEVVSTLLKLMGGTQDRMEFVADRPGHDFRYAMDISKIQKAFSYTPQFTFDKGLAQTLQWYQSHTPWNTPTIHPKGVRHEHPP